jgi:halimadienyl-diphosphate synthase
MDIMDNNSIDDILGMSPGHTFPTAYDTAWVAKLGDVCHELSNPALEWLCEHQLPDGSWGTQTPYYYHDRIISTLAAMIALTHQGRRTRDKKQIEKGLVALDSIASMATHGLNADPNGATAGFEMIVPTLVAEAEQLGLIQQQGTRILGRLAIARKHKMAVIERQRITRKHTLAFSAEMAGADWGNFLDIDNLREADGSVAHSPSASAYFASLVQVGEPGAINYLRNAMSPDGGAGIAVPFEIYEIAWVLWNIGLIEGSAQNESLQRYLTQLRAAWKHGEGVGFTHDHSISDGDDTAMVASLLARFGNERDLETLRAFTNRDHFRCFPLEIDPSVSTNVHFLDALRHAGESIDHPDVQLIIRFLKKEQVNGTYWFDKWHASPYYTTAHAIITCSGYCNNLVEKSVEWLISSQRLDGSWGFYSAASAEETAYALQALAVWKRCCRGKFPAEILRRGAAWLKSHQDVSLSPSLWIAKSLYMSSWVISAEIFSALKLVEQTI